MNYKKLMVIILSIFLVLMIIAVILLSILIKENKQGETIKNEIPVEMSLEEYEKIDEEEGDYSTKRNREAEVTRADYGGLQNCIQSYLNEKYSNDSNLLTFSILDIRKLQDDNVKSFAVHVVVQLVKDYSLVENDYLIVNIDTNNLTFLIEQVKNVNDISQIILTTNLKEIKADESNMFKYKAITELDIIQEYVNIYKRVSFVYPEYIFNKLNKEYRDKKFGSVEEFKKHINNNQEKIKNITIEQYKIDNSNAEYTQYICADTNHRYYIIKEVSVGNYEMMLDAYTIELPENVEQYKKASNNEKVALNIQKVILAINEKDYKYVYNKLDETFKQTNFDTIEEFERKINNYFFNSNTATIKSIENVSEVYVCNVTLKSGIGLSAEERNLSFVMQLKEGTDFVMSFSK